MCRRAQTQVAFDWTKTWQVSISKFCKIGASLCRRDSLAGWRATHRILRALANAAIMPVSMSGVAPSPPKMLMQDEGVVSAWNEVQRQHAVDEQAEANARAAACREFNYRPHGHNMHTPLGDTF